MRNTIEFWKKYWKSIFIIHVSLAAIFLLWIWYRSSLAPPTVELNFVIKGTVKKVIPVNSRRSIVQLSVSESNVVQYDVRDQTESWCCVVNGHLAEIVWYPYNIQIGDSMVYGPSNRVKVFRGGEKVDEDKIGLSPLGGIFEKIRVRHEL